MKFKILIFTEELSYQIDIFYVQQNQISRIQNCLNIQLQLHSLTKLNN